MCDSDYAPVKLRIKSNNYVGDRRADIARVERKRNNNIYTNVSFRFPCNMSTDR